MISEIPTQRHADFLWEQAKAATARRLEHETPETIKQQHYWCSRLKQLVNGRR